MARTSAERQAAYRSRRATGNGERRLSIWITTEADLALGRLARRYAVTKKAMLEQLVAAADDDVHRHLARDSPEWREYFSVVR